MNKLFRMANEPKRGAKVGAKENEIGNLMLASASSSWATRIDLGFHAASSLFDHKVSGHAPSAAPRVGAKPVVETGDGIVTVADDNNSMAAFESSRRRSDIDTRFVVKEIRVDRETSFNGSVSGDFGLDGRDGGELFDGTRLLLVEFDRVTVSASGWARSNRSTAGGVCEASDSRGTSGSKIILNLIDVTSAAAVTTSVTGENVLFSHVIRGETRNASTPGEFFGSTEGPA